MYNVRASLGENYCSSRSHALPNLMRMIIVLGFKSQQSTRCVDVLTRHMDNNSRNSDISHNTLIALTSR